MALFSNPKKYCHIFQTQACSFLSNMITFFFVVLLMITKTNSVSFQFTNFNSNLVTFQGDATSSLGVIHLTRSTTPQASSFGRASYSKRVRLWDANTGELTDFTTHFSFVITAFDKTCYGDGISFFIAPFDLDIPEDSSGGYLGLFSPDFAKDSSLTNYPIVAVEFDTLNNDWDPISDHVGININSIESKIYLELEYSFKDGGVANVSVSYNSTSKTLNVSLLYGDDDPSSTNQVHVSYGGVDLKSYLPEIVRVGFSGATGTYNSCGTHHNILSWSFNSSLEEVAEPSLVAPRLGDPSLSLGARAGRRLMADDKSLENSRPETPERKRKRKRWLGLKIGLPVCLFSCGLCFMVWFIFWRKRNIGKGNEEEKESDQVSINDEFEKGAGPKRFTYRELRRATNKFAEEGKLGEGGFGDVYKGLLRESNIQVAVKRVSKDSKQSKRRQYISEVRIISRLRHKNLVKLIGWCHEKGEFLLVYEFMPNGSLDFLLFSSELVLPWSLRYKIALGLASALLYLHEEWEECVVHRDIKSSNIMLDSNFNAKLGDFGLARLVDHEDGLETTHVIAGTRGYMAPEYISSGKASKESDVYSFGVVALEISTGRKPYFLTNLDESGKINIVEWVWELYGKSRLFEAVDQRLGIEFNKPEMECLMVVGLWCCHPDPSFRPSIKQVMDVLNFEVPLPKVPSKLPVPVYFEPVSLHNTSSAISQSNASSSGATTRSSTTSTTFAGHSKPLLKLPGDQN